MASLTKRRGKFIARFYDATGKRKSITLTTSSERRAQGDVEHIEALIECHRYGESPRRGTRAWLEGLSREMIQRLSTAGLIEATTEPQRPDAPQELGPQHAELGAEQITLVQFLDDYFKRRKRDVKAGTWLHWGHTRQNLIDHFGNDKRLASFTLGDAADFESYLRHEARDRRRKGDEAGLSHNTVRKRLANAKLFFADATDRELIDKNPFRKVKSAVTGNPDLFYFITRDQAQKVIEACPDAQWRLIFALSRYGGLRCPSEHLRIRWEHVDFESGRLRVPSSKTEHQGKAYRFVPIFPELRPFLKEAFELAGPKVSSSDPVITRYRDARQNLRTQLLKIIARAGLQPWPKLFQNLRSTRQTELQETFPDHVVCAWIGNTKQVASRHYLQVTDDHFRRAVEGQLPGAASTMDPILDPIEPGNGSQVGLPVSQNPEKTGLFSQAPATEWAVLDSNQ